jgi:hypothetical protein
MRRGKERRNQFKAKRPRKIKTITPYSKNACKRHITSNQFKFIGEDINET